MSKLRTCDGIALICQFLNRVDSKPSATSSQFAFAFLRVFASQGNTCAACGAWWIFAFL